MTILLGAIADDFTGATDLANTLAKEGMPVVQIIGVPDDNTDIGDAQAVVVALKSRTAPVAEAVEQSVAAMKWLVEQGANQIISKYCSTFDSTKDGNIGPIADALMSEIGAEYAFICPAFPENKRTIYQGHLFVGPDLLSESSMKDHPLTPMRDANLVRLMTSQSKREVGLIPLQIVRNGVDAIIEQSNNLINAGASYAVIDAISDDDLRTIGYAARNHKLITGGSGVALGLPDNFRRQGLLNSARIAALPSVPGRELVLAGSCSSATRKQIAIAKEKWPTEKINVDAIARGDNVVTDMANWALDQNSSTPVLIYASADPEEVAQTQAKYGEVQAGQMVEQVMGDLAKTLTSKGFSRLIVAGGETSGAVVSALQVKTLRIGPEIAPGVPWTESMDAIPMALALKSGNFGGTNFFKEAFDILP